MFNIGCLKIVLYPRFDVTFCVIRYHVTAQLPKKNADCVITNDCVLKPKLKNYIANQKFKIIIKILSYKPTNLSDYYLTNNMSLSHSSRDHTGNILKTYTLNHSFKRKYKLIIIKKRK